MSIVWVHERTDSESMDQDVMPGSQSLAFVRRFDVLTDDVNDGPVTVSNADDGATAIPDPFDTYSKGSDENLNAVATRCRTRRDKNKLLLWHVTVEYHQAVDFDTTGSMSGSTDLTCYLPSARTWKVPMEKVIWQARRQLPAIGGNAAETFATAMARSKEPIVNSFNKLFVDGITTVKHARAWEIRRYEWYFDEEQAEIYTDVVNETCFWGHDPGTVKMVSIGGDLQTVANQLIWLVTYEFHICEDGWGEQVIDNGMERWCTDDGSVPSVAANATGQCIIKDHMGQPISAPVLLDGAGYITGAVSNPLDPDGSPIVVTWHHLEQQDFGAIIPALPSPQDLYIIATLC